MVKTTPKSRIVSALRMLWLKSPERYEAIKQAEHCCERCGVRESKAKGQEQKIEVHHKDGILNWDDIVEDIRAQLLVSADKLEVLCPACHKAEHNGEHAAC